MDIRVVLQRVLTLGLLCVGGLVWADESAVQELIGRSHRNYSAEMGAEIDEMVLRYPEAEGIDELRLHRLHSQREQYRTEGDKAEDLKELFASYRAFAEEVGEDTEFGYTSLLTIGIVLGDNRTFKETYKEIAEYFQEMENNPILYKDTLASDYKRMDLYTRIAHNASLSREMPEVAGKYASMVMAYQFLGMEDREMFQKFKDLYRPASHAFLSAYKDDLERLQSVNLYWESGNTQKDYIEELTNPGAPKKATDSPQLLGSFPVLGVELKQNQNTRPTAQVREPSYEKMIAIPAVLDFGKIYWDDIHTKTFTIRCEKEGANLERIELRGISKSSVSVEVVNSTKTEMTVDVTLSKTERGSLSSYPFEFIYAGTGKTAVRAMIKAQVIPPLKLAKRQFHLGRKKPDELIVRSIPCSIKPGSSTHIKSMKFLNSNTAVNYSVVPQENGYQLDVEFRLPQEDGLFNDILVIETSAPEYKSYFGMAAYADETL